MGFIRATPPPTAAFPLAGDGRVDSASGGGAESEHTGIRFSPLYFHDAISLQDSVEY